MKKAVFLLLILICVCGAFDVMAQCSLCTKTAQQLGEGPAKGLNQGILYMAFAPLLIIGLLGYRWWRSEKQNN
jgi:hypothetical protein